MADMSFKNIAIAFLLVSLFAISIYNFAIGVGVSMVTLLMNFYPLMKLILKV